jgi:Glycosyltransferase family 87
VCRAMTPGALLPRLRPSWLGQFPARLAVRALAIGWIVFFWVWLIGFQSTFVEVDAQAYWGLNLDTLYQGVQLGDQGAFLYSPVVAWILLPFSALPYEVFYALLAAVNLAALVWLIGPELAALSLFLVPISNEVARGNIHLLLAAAIVAGFRYHASWAPISLTKVTPGVGSLWFAMRREWRAFAWAIGATIAIVVVSFAVAPDLWLRWFGMLAGSANVTRPSVLPIPVLPRIAVAVVLVAVGAWRNRPAIVPVAAMIALQAIWVNSLAMLVAVIPLWRAGPSGHRETGRHT